MRNYVECVQPITLDSKTGRSGLKLHVREFFDDQDPADRARAVEAVTAYQRDLLPHLGERDAMPRIAVWAPCAIRAPQIRGQYLTELS